ncbi:MAG: adenylate/guanylate cyclase domain-containing protein [Sphingosinicella sp.]|uniref:adenylate/guanylate cyclase domain-containing protein n=1 Tax=Sphingosinicella sp. TaxID=1917971 RepID=UPI0040377A50
MTGAAESARGALSRGDLIGAYDATVAAIAEGDDSPAIRHLQVLALARMGDTDRAMELFAASGLDASPDPHERAVGARLLKDKALSLPPGAASAAALAGAFDAYHAIYAASGDAFPGINAATLALLAGDTARAHVLAEALLADPAVAAAANYYDAATKAEALLILGRTGEVTAALAAPPVRESRDYGARCSTLRQLAMIAAHLGLDSEALLAPLAPPRVAHFCGHIFVADAEAESRLRAAIDAVIEAETVGFAYGALAAGADILFAEALLARGAELHLVLPFAEEDFLAQSVRPAGEPWLARYAACRDRAATLTFAGEMEFFGDGAQYGYGSRMAMGLARLRAEHLAAEAVQLAIWDGKAANGDAGTGIDVAAWRDGAGRTVAIEPGQVERGLTRPEPRVRSAYDRALAAILFTDFAGFSTLSETALPAFWDGVMHRVAEVLDRHGDEVACRNSWGDALYAVMQSATGAAEIALELQDALARFDYATLGLDGAGGMRIGVHYGPAYRTIDRITGRTTFYGTEVSKAARIEPVTPPGAVFVTEPFAAILALEAGSRFTSRYVGRIPLAKKYGDYPMYRLTRAD